MGNKDRIRAAEQAVANQEANYTQQSLLVKTVTEYTESALQTPRFLKTWWNDSKK